MYQALYRKWRPRTFQEVVGQNHITDTLRRQVAQDRLSHAYLFTGTRGTGKTTCAKILARAVNCQHPVDGDPCNSCPACLGIEDGSILDVVELDAASNNGVDQVRALRDEAVYAPADVRKRVYIIDEVHMLSTAAFNALLKILEEPPEHLMFILATTEVHKVPATIKSRCQQFAFRRLLPAEIAGRLNEISAAEKIPLSTDAADLLAQLADGSMRDGLSLLDQCAGYAETVDVPQVLEALGMTGSRETASLLEAVALGDSEQVLETLNGLYAAGKELRALLEELSSLVRDLLILQVAPKGGGALLSGGYDRAELERLEKLLPPARLSQMLGTLQTTLNDLGRGGSPRTDTELCLLRLCDPALDESPAGLAARLERLERGAVTSSPAAAETGKEVKKTASGPAEKNKTDADRDQTPAAGKIEPEPAAEEMPASEEIPEAAVDASAGEAAPAREGNAEESAPEEPKAAADAGKAGNGGEPGYVVPEFWPALLRDLKGNIPDSKYAVLQNESFTGCCLHGDVLQLWTPMEVHRDLLDQKAVLEPLQKRASELAGRPLRVSVLTGTVPADGGTEPRAEQEDSFQELLDLGDQFDNITIKGV
ncbi:MAG: DNA polymerase III subunit gamma/tau [Oscillospiraceae bacterium]|nr:DNA polymerase III subunit gamma/tau [Oscillospiraceae bacterium]